MTRLLARLVILMASIVPGVLPTTIDNPNGASLMASVHTSVPHSALKGTVAVAVRGDFASEGADATLAPCIVVIR
jgi:hypothetical protein